MFNFAKKFVESLKNKADNERCRRELEKAEAKEKLRNELSLKYSELVAELHRKPDRKTNIAAVYFSGDSMLVNVYYNKEDWVFCVDKEYDGSDFEAVKKILESDVELPCHPVPPPLCAPENVKEFCKEKFGIDPQ